MNTMAATQVAPKKVYKSRKSKIAEENGFKPTLTIEIDTSDPKRIMFGAYFLNPDSPTYGNAMQSAIKSGFAKTYAKNILNQGGQWVRDILDQFRKSDLLQLAHDNLRKDLTIDEKEQMYYQGLPIVNPLDSKPVLIDNTKKMEIRSKATALVIEALDPMFQKKEKGIFDGLQGTVNFNFFTPDNTPVKDATVDKTISIPTNGPTT